MSVGAVLPLALLGALLGLDSVGFPQAMLSRPLVASSLTGALLGVPEAGLMVGATLEFMALETLPFGASRYPEWGPAGVVAAALYAPTREHTGALVTAVLAALAVAWVGGASMVWVRRLNARWLHARRDALRAGSAHAVSGLQLAALSADMLRGALLTVAALVVAVPLQRLALDQWAGAARDARAVVAGAAITIGAAATWKIFHSVAAARWLFAVGLLLGAAVLVGRA